MLNKNTNKQNRSACHLPEKLAESSSLNYISVSVLLACDSFTDRDKGPRTGTTDNNKRHFRFHLSLFVPPAPCRPSHLHLIFSSAHGSSSTFFIFFILLRRAPISPPAARSNFQFQLPGAGIQHLASQLQLRLLHHFPQVYLLSTLPACLRRSLTERKRVIEQPINSRSTRQVQDTSRAKRASAH